MCRKLCHAGRAVHRRRLEELGREHLEARVHHEEHERDRAPGVDERDRHERQPRIAEPGQGTEPDRAQVVVQHAKLGMEDHAPHRGADDRHDEERQQQEDADRTEKLERLSEEQRQPEAGQELDQHGTRGEESGDDDGARELGIVGEARVVGEPDESDVARADQPPVVEADPR